ncbi:MAG: hypothetical protein JSS23_11430 [Proteobacteria bacterium]|nr:hypothetical protein [Pseudomonadota bacterium]
MSLQLAFDWTRGSGATGAGLYHHSPLAVPVPRLYTPPPPRQGQAKLGPTEAMQAPPGDQRHPHQPQRQPTNPQAAATRSGDQHDGGDTKDKELPQGGFDLTV